MASTDAIIHDEMTTTKETLDITIDGTRVVFTATYTYYFPSTLIFY